LPEAPDVSVVIATCNRPYTLVQAIRSALGQAGARVEVIVVDDSVDHTAAVAVQGLSDTRIRYVGGRKPSYGRPAIARNHGVSLARGPLVHF
jgi:glycosyltransferase involved in cell wall biosynthesis